MQLPVNFDSVSLDGILSDWICALREFSVEAVVVLGPDPFGTVEDRQVLAVHPPVVADAAQALAESRDFGAPWRDSDAPLVAWQHIAKSDHLSAGRWRLLSLAHGFQTVIRVEFSLPAGRAFECFMFSPRELNDRAEAASLVWSALNIWPLVRRCIATARSTLSPRERECLVLAFEGLTARESAARLHCSDRTVNYHLANAMNKLKVDNKMAAIQRACWIGAI
ncbi:MAG: LuxR C-terminal-related transcriptional regulator [Ramlibacter sp.]|nr:helix-turn-helix transcriptional regulator [Ramlibacter sp.]